MLQLELRKSSSLSRSGKLHPIKDSCPIIVEDSPLEPSTLKSSEDYNCHFCHKRFSRHHNLKSHLLLHGNRDSFECRGKASQDPGSSWGCKQGFKTAFNLYNHFQSDRGRLCIAHLLADEGLQIARDPGELELPSSSITGGSDAASPMRALPLPMSLLRQFPELQHYEQFACLDPDGYQTLRVFKSRYNSTSSRSSKKSGISDEGYHTADGDFDTSPDMALAPIRRPSSRLVSDSNLPQRTATPRHDDAQPHATSDARGESPVFPSINIVDTGSPQAPTNVTIGDLLVEVSDIDQNAGQHDRVESPFEMFSDDALKPSCDGAMEEGPYRCVNCGQRYIYHSTLQHHRGTSPLCGRTATLSSSRDCEWESADYEAQTHSPRVGSQHSEPPTDLAWQSVRKDVIRCHKERGLTVNETRCWLSLMRDFHVTQQMLETQLSIWGYDAPEEVQEQGQTRDRARTRHEPRVAPAQVTRTGKSLTADEPVEVIDVNKDLHEEQSEMHAGKKLALAFRPSVLSKRLRLRKDRRSVSDAAKKEILNVSVADMARQPSTAQSKSNHRSARFTMQRRVASDCEEASRTRSPQSRQAGKSSEQHQLEFLLSKSKSNSADSSVGQTRDFPSPTLSKSTNKPNNNSESELSFINMSSNPDSQALDQLDDETRHFVTQLATRIVFRCADSVSQRAIRSHAASNSSSQPSSSNSKETPTTTSSIPSKRMRRGESKENDSHDDDEGSDPPESKRKRGNGDIEAKLFACPYAKYDPERYSERNHSEKRYRKCNSKYLNSITRVKQHLYRTHARPSWYCGNCYESFESREGLNEHMRRRPPCESAPVMYEEMMTDDQFQAVKRRSVANDPFESWFKIFEILFPDTARPLSPYVSTCDPTTVAHFVSFFRRCGPEELLNLMRDRREQNGEQSIQLTASTQAIVDEAFEIALPDYLERLEDSPESQNETVPATVTAATSSAIPRTERLQHTRSTRQDSSASVSSSSRYSDHRHTIPTTQSHQSGATSILCSAHTPSHPHPYAHDWTTQTAPYIQHALHAMGEPVKFRSSFGTEMEAEDISFLDPSQVDRAFDAYDASVMADVSDVPVPGQASYEWIDPPIDIAAHPVDLSMDMQWQYLPGS